ncbi:MAG TPA: GIY-YIG nuclease family protein [Candidatus Saccharibacteria bacterium]|nr:GIY-YIG nuclease family protein [Candidatus Saccharibacteria bacterium]
MFYFYILKLSNNNYYYGSTSDLKDRLSRHQRGRSKYTQKYLPLELIYYEAYNTRSQAMNREKQVKSSSSIRKSIINRLAS